MPDTTTPPTFDAASQATLNDATRVPQQAGLTRAQLQAAASVLAHVHSRPHSFAPSSGNSAGASPA